MAKGASVESFARHRARRARNTVAVRKIEAQISLAEWPEMLVDRVAHRYFKTFNWRELPPQHKERLLRIMRCTKPSEADEIMPRVRG